MDGGLGAHRELQAGKLVEWSLQEGIGKWLGRMVRMEVVGEWYGRQLRWGQRVGGGLDCGGGLGEGEERE